ncbi:MAG: hypothetical protein LQ339_005486 [Xanthoria mediterranea]|nr:MAG: hypothetical protein LQ339_005486 [Xanthoria mediterranea]
MFALTTTALVFITAAFHPLVTSSPLTTQNQPSISPNATLSALNDWENFAYPIPSPNNQILKGRIFTSKPLRPGPLQSVIDGVLAYAQRHVSDLGPTARLYPRDNGLCYRDLGGCFFEIRSKVDRGEGNRPIMTWLMVRDVLLALREVLVRGQKSFQTSFVLVDDQARSWGHGEIREGISACNVVEVE